MREIAIFTVKEFSHYDDYTKIVDSITEWTEVSDEDYRLLYKFSERYNWNVLERLDKKPGFVLSTVEAALEEVRKEEEQARLAMAVAEEKKQERLLKKRAKDEAAEKKLLEQLLAKHGDK
jgi:hypothetical protein